MHRTARQLRLVVLALTSGLAGILCLVSCTPDEERPEEIVVGWISPGVSDRSTAIGAIMMAADLTRSGGIEIDGRRHPFHLLLEESTNSPEVATARALEMINREGAVALLGLSSTNTARPVSRLAERHGVPMVTLLSSHPDTTADKRFSFRLTVLDSTQGRVLAEHALSELGARRAGALIDASNPYFVSLAAEFRHAFEALGGKVVASEIYTQDIPSVGEHLDRLHRSSVDVILLPNVSSWHLEDLKRAWADGLSIPLLGGDSWSATTEDQSQAIENLYYVSLWAPEVSPAAAAFARRVAEERGLEANAAMALGADAILLIAEAIRRQGSFDPSDIRDGIDSLEAFSGVTGTYRFAGQNGNPHRPLYVRKIHRGKNHLVATVSAEISDPSAD